MNRRNYIFMMAVDWKIVAYRRFLWIMHRALFLIKTLHTQLLPFRSIKKNNKKKQMQILKPVKRVAWISMIRSLFNLKSVQIGTVQFEDGILRTPTMNANDYLRERGRSFPTYKTGWERLATGDLFHPFTWPYLSNWHFKHSHELLFRRHLKVWAKQQMRQVVAMLVTSAFACRFPTPSSTGQSL